jgi:DNA polymerase
LGSEAAEALLRVREDLGDCQRCRLAQGRIQLVFGVGSPSARVVFVGEGPGEEEDRRGEPFVGRAGQLLDRMLRAIDLERARVYIANVVKCRPPGNRTPHPDEAETCLPFLWRQIEAIRPVAVCALGGHAAKSLLGTETPISRLRGKPQRLRGVSVLPTFHPAYLLRNPAAKRLAWEDLKRLETLLHEGA